MCAKYYENPTMLSRVIAKNVGDVFLRHTVGLLTLRYAATIENKQAMSVVRKMVTDIYITR